FELSDRSIDSATAHAVKSHLGRDFNLAGADVTDQVGVSDANWLHSNGSGKIANVKASASEFNNLNKDVADSANAFELSDRSIDSATAHAVKSHLGRDFNLAGADVTDQVGVSDALWAHDNGAGHFSGGIKGQASELKALQEAIVNKSAHFVLADNYIDAQVAKGLQKYLGNNFDFNHANITNEVSVEDALWDQAHDVGNFSGGIKGYASELQALDRSVIEKGGRFILVDSDIDSQIARNLAAHLGRDFDFNGANITNQTSVQDTLWAHDNGAGKFNGGIRGQASELKALQEAIIDKSSGFELSDRSIDSATAHAVKSHLGRDFNLAGADVTDQVGVSDANWLHSNGSGKIANVKASASEFNNLNKDVADSANAFELSDRSIDSATAHAVKSHLGRDFNLAGADVTDQVGVSDANWLHSNGSGKIANVKASASEFNNLNKDVADSVNGFLLSDINIDIVAARSLNTRYGDKFNFNATNISGTANINDLTWTQTHGVKSFDSISDSAENILSYSNNSGLKSASSVHIDSDSNGLLQK
ncbi:MAG: hypothetical protein WCG68_05505, partial [Actinomycetes bacterium]